MIGEGRRFIGQVLRLALGVGFGLGAEAAVADLYVGVGGGIAHSGGLALHVAAPVRDHVEVHYSHWDDRQTNAAVGIGYRLDNGSAVSLVLGAAYIGKITDNLLHHADAYIEVRVRPLRNFSCQVSHYSTIGDDSGENFLLCGLHWRGPW